MRTWKSWLSAALSGCCAPRRRGVWKQQQSSSSSSAATARLLEQRRLRARGRRAPIRPSPSWSGGDQVQGHADRGGRRQLRARTSSSPPTARRSSGWTLTWSKALGGGDGPEGQRRQRDLRRHHPRPGGRQVRHGRLVVHRHQGAREDRRLRRLLHRRRVVLHQGVSGGTAIASSPTSAARRSPSRRARPRRPTPQTQSGKCKKARQGRRHGARRSRTRTAPTWRCRSGRAQLGFADSPVAAYQVKKSNGQFKLVGATLATAPYGLAIPKNSGLAQAVLAALKALMQQRHLHARSSPSGASRRGAIPASQVKINGATLASSQTTAPR